MNKNYSDIAMQHTAVQADDPEKYVRESFTWRGMEAWQVWSLTAICGALLVAIAIAQVF